MKMSMCQTFSNFCTRSLIMFVHYINLCSFLCQKHYNQITFIFNDLYEIQKSLSINTLWNITSYFTHDFSQSNDLCNELLPLDISTNYVLRNSTFSFSVAVGSNVFCFLYRCFIYNVIRIIRILNCNFLLRALNIKSFVLKKQWVSIATTKKTTSRHTLSFTIVPFHV